MAKNEFKPFATANGANVTSQSEYETLSALATGFQAGKASSAQINKAIRQASVIASVVAQFIADESGDDVLDDGDVSVLQQSLLEALKQNAADNLPIASTTTSGIAKLNSATDSSDETMAATPKAVKAANDNANGRVPSAGGEITGQLFVHNGLGAAGQTNYLPSRQGAHLSWNRDGASGKSELINHRGSGDGGFTFWNGTETSLDKLADLSAAGSLSVKGELLENGLRVYGPNNKPSVADIGAVSVSTAQTITGKKLFSADNDALTIKPTADGQRSYIQFNNASSSEAVALVGLRYGTDELGLTLEHKSGASIRITDGEVNLYGVPRVVTADEGTNTTQIASTAFVQSAIAGTAGIPFPWPRTMAPVGWLKCNGQSFDVTAYPILALSYPSGVLPDLRGEFIRGWDDERGVDAGRALLSEQAGMVESHNHMLPISDPKLWDGAVYGYASNQSLVSLEDIANAVISSSRELTSMTGGNETRPRNITFTYIVRAA